MAIQALDITTSQFEHEAVEALREEYQVQDVLLQMQPMDVQRYLSSQARLVAKSIDEHLSPMYFNLPERVACQLDSRIDRTLLNVPGEVRKQKVGGLLDRLKAMDLIRRLEDLEASPELAISISARVLRHATAVYMVSELPPDEGEFDSYQNLFYAPWVGFDEHGNLRVDSLEVAKEHISAMQHYLDTLRAVETLAPYMIADRVFQRKQHGMTRQLVIQGRALARYETDAMIFKIQRRLAIGNLNRGLSLSLPYFDEAALAMKSYDFEVIPAGRLGFEPIYLVRAARYEQNRLEKDDRLSPSTRHHLLDELKKLEQAFMSFAGDIDGRINI